MRNLVAEPLAELVARVRKEGSSLTARRDEPRVIVSPYRFNPLGAHIDHQGGAVMARTLDQYTVLCCWPEDDAGVTLHSRQSHSAPCRSFSFVPTEPFAAPPHTNEYAADWQHMAWASFAALADYEDLPHPLTRGLSGVVAGTLVSGGLSSSASVILAYLTASAAVNDIELDARTLVELCRRVENDYRGLNNGVQDQMSIAFARPSAMTVLDVNTVDAAVVADPPGFNEMNGPTGTARVAFLMCYSGVSRQLGSGFNTRVAECREAAGLLHADAAHLGEVPECFRDESAVAALPPVLARRARHVYGEMQRVRDGAVAWQAGDFERFGELMNQSCQSSITQYESGSEWLIALHEIARDVPGVLGNRFSGGGYGGCLFMLVDESRIERIAATVLAQYLQRYPDKRELARLQRVGVEGSVRVL